LRMENLRCGWCWVCLNVPSLRSGMEQGISWDPAFDFLEEILPKPTLWTESGSTNPWGVLLTIWCEGNLEAQEYNLFKEKS
jgi:hypothetical protein